MIRERPPMLLDHIEAYMRHTKTSPTRFGREAVGDPHFVTSLRDGRRPRRATVERVMTYIACRDRAGCARRDGR